MEDLKKFAHIIVHYSCSVKEGENVFIVGQGLACKPLVSELITQIYSVGANPFVDFIDIEIQREILLGCNEKQMETYGEATLEKMKKMDVMINIFANENASQYADVPIEKMSIYNKNFMNRCFFDYAVQNLKWISIKYPTNSMAQLFDMSLKAFEEYYYSVCNHIDYPAMSLAMDRLVRKMEDTDRVRILGPGTDLSFSIKDIPVAKSDGRNSLPDGEVFTAPVKDSANGYITFNCPLYFRGILFENIYLELKDGKIVTARSADNSDKLNQQFDIDEGSRNLGEFAIAINPKIIKPMKDILFDEKIAGSFHMAVGNSYYTTDNGNHSLIHMDIVSIQTPEYGGGEIYFDGVLIRKDGKFVVEELEELNNL